MQRRMAPANMQDEILYPKHGHYYSLKASQQGLKYTSSMQKSGIKKTKQKWPLFMSGEIQNLELQSLLNAMSMKMQ